MEEKDGPNVGQDDSSGHILVPPDPDQADEARNQNWKEVCHNDVDQPAPEAER